MVRQIYHPTVVAKNPAENRAQQRYQHFSAARGGHHVEHKPLRHQRPHPTLVAIGPPTRLIHIQDRFARQLLLQLLNGLFRRLADFFPGFAPVKRMSSSAKMLRGSGPMADSTTS